MEETKEQQQLGVEMGGPHTLEVEQTEEHHQKGAPTTHTVVVEPGEM